VQNTNQSDRIRSNAWQLYKQSFSDSGTADLSPTERAMWAWKSAREFEKIGETKCNAKNVK